MNISDSEQRNNSLSISLLTSGLCLTVMLPIGIWVGIGKAFTTLLILHITGMLFTSFLSLRIIFRRSSAVSTGLILILFLALMAIFSLVPITARDALIHHLAIAKLWASQGIIQDIPWHTWSYYPNLIQLVFTGLEYQGLTYLTPFYIGLYLLILAGLVIEVIKNIDDTKYASEIGIFIIFATPVIFKLSTVPLVDLPLSCFSFAAFGILLNKQKTKILNIDLFFSGIAIGLAVSTKPNGALIAVIFGIWALVILKSLYFSFSQTVRALLIVVTPSLLIYLPWMIRNYILINSPLFPILGSGLYESSSLALSNDLQGFLSQRIYKYNETIKDIALLPFRMFFLGRDNSPQFFDGVLSPILLMGFLAPSTNKKIINSLKLVCITYIVIALLTGPARVRYIAPIFGHLALLTSLSIVYFYKKYGKTLFVILLVHAVYFTKYIINLEKDVGALSYLNGDFINRDDYLTKKLSEYSAIKWMNNNIERNSLTYLILTGNKYYLYNTPVRSPGQLSAQEVLKAILDSKSKDDILNFFNERKVTHIMANIQRVNKVFSSYLNEPSAMSARSNWSDFVTNNLNIMYKDRQNVIWEIKF